MNSFVRPKPNLHPWRVAFVRGQWGGRTRTSLAAAHWPLRKGDHTTASPEGEALQTLYITPTTLMTIIRSILITALKAAKRGDLQDKTALTLTCSRSSLRPSTDLPENPKNPQHPYGYM